MRQPSIGRLIALLIGATVVLLVTIDTTMACRFWLRHQHCAPCPSVPRCAAPAPPTCAPAIVEGCCGSEVIESPSIIYQEYEEEVEGVVESTSPTPAPRVEALEPAPMPTDVEPAITDLAPEDVPATSIVPDDDFVEPAVVEEPTIVEDDLPAVEDQLEDDLFELDTPAADEPAADDLFSEPTDQMPNDDLDILDTPADDAVPADDLFDAPADAAADDLFDAPADAAADDLFDAPADAAADDLFDAPADAAADDLFDSPADAGADALDSFDQPAPLDEELDLPGFDDPVPGDAPADAAPTDDSDNLDDLFGSNNDVSDPEPRTAAAVSPVSDDLFDGFETPATNADTVPADQLLDPPPADRDNAVDDLDDLFGGPAATPEVTKTVAEQIEELPMRTWTDNTGRFETVGRLVKVSPTHIRLLKENGRYSTVPKHRLSEADLEYVDELTQQLGVQYFDQVALR